MLVDYQNSECSLVLPLKMHSFAGKTFQTQNNSTFFHIFNPNTEVTNGQYSQRDYVEKQFAQIIMRFGIPQEAWKCIFSFWYTRFLSSYYFWLLEIILVAVWFAVIFSSVNRRHLSSSPAWNCVKGHEIYHKWFWIYPKTFKFLFLGKLKNFIGPIFFLLIFHFLGYITPKEVFLL